ncbi:hypothetical protein KUA24_159 [Vibrio phage HNL01]|nr:hypothetical protein KUA24_159 [Vibrio phage HNL01]
MHQPIASFEPMRLGECLLDGFEDTLYPAMTCNQAEFDDLMIVTHYLGFSSSSKSEITGIVDDVIRNLCYNLK